MARPGLSHHRKFSRLCLLLKVPKCTARGILELLWDRAYENGDAFLGDATDIKLATDFRGGADKLAKALLDCGGEGQAGFIEEVKPAGYRVHDLYDHCPEYVKKRFDREDARRTAGKTLSEVRAEAASQRWKNRGGDANDLQMDANECRLHPDGSNCHANGTTPAPAPAPAPSIKSARAVASEAGGFDRFWATYPRKVAKAAAVKAWAKISPDHELTNIIVGAIQRQAQSDQWVRDDGKFVPYPATWLNGRRWEDEVAEPADSDDGSLGPPVRMTVEELIAKGIVDPPAEGGAH
jgi:hypothetical protein